MSNQAHILIFTITGENWVKNVTTEHEFQNKCKCVFQIILEFLKKVDPINCDAIQEHLNIFQKMTTNYKDTQSWMWERPLISYLWLLNVL